MFPPKKNPYPWENQIDNGGLGLPAPVSNAVSPPYVNPSIDPGGLGLPAPIGNTVSPPLQGNRQYSAEEQDFLRRNPGDEHRMAEALRGGGGTPNYTAPSTPPGQPPVTSTRADLDAAERADPRLGYGYNADSWSTNKRIEAQADAMNWSGNPSGRANWLNNNQSYYGRTDPRNPPGYVGGLPDEATYYAHRAGRLAPYNASVASERAAGRPGFNGDTTPITPPPASIPLPPGTGGDIIPGGTPPPYVNPSMNPGGNMSNTPTPGITRPTGGVMQPKLPQGSAGGNMNVPPLSGQLPRTGEFQASRKRIPNYVGS